MNAAERYPNLDSLAQHPESSVNPAIGEQCRDALAEIDRLRGYIDSVVCLLMNEDGGQVGVCVEPETEPGAYVHPNGFTFELGQAFTDEFWDDLVTVQEQS